MKILIIRTFPNIINPATYNIQEIGLAKALIRKGHECGIVLYYGKNKDNIEYIPIVTDNGEKQIIIYRLHGYNLLKNGIFPSLHKIAKQYDVLQVHEYDQFTSWLYYAWGKKNVVIYHGPYYHTFNKGYNLKCKIFDHTFLKIRHNRSVPCLTKSHAAAAFLMQKGFQNVLVASVGLDDEVLKKPRIVSVNEKNIEMVSDDFFFLYVGKIEERRNPFFLLQLIKEMSEKYKKVKFLIIGNGEKSYQHKFLDQAEPLIKNGTIQYYESATQQKMAEIYGKAQVMLFPTYYDIFGMVLLEAMYFNIPVISSKNGGEDMLIENGKNGYVIPEFNSQLWMEKMELLYTKKTEYEKMTQFINRMDKHLLSWDNISDRFIEKYKEVENENN